MASKNLLVELFVEELPPKSLKKLGESFAATLASSLKAQDLAGDSAEVVAYATPRRLAVWVSGVSTQAADKRVSQKLMPVAVGLDANGNATPALLKKLAALGADASVVPNLTQAADGKAQALFFENVLAGATLAEGLQKALDETLAKLPIAKVMTYPNPSGEGWATVNFVRPAHGLVALHGADIVPISTLGLQAGRTTQGHRFEAAKAVISLNDADNYAQQLADEGAVIASFAERRADIVRQLTAAAALQNLQPIEDEALLDEVTALVERPNVLMGQFEAEFLAVPQECLILTMKANQKYFPLLDANGKLTNKFLIVSNIRPADASLVIQGNERVVRPRLADAKFFFDQDRKKPLDARMLGLSKVVYHNKLGTQGERVERVQAIARAIAAQLGDETLVRQADQAALLAKADLLTDMVGEFPELQGIMGRYYAQHDGLSPDIAYAIEDHYKPRFAGDELPRNTVGICVALADKLETLVGMFGIGQIPTGDKDPFALRRHALGVIRMLVENALPLNVLDLVRAAFAGFPAGVLNDANAEVANFVYDRLSGTLREQGYSAQEVDAVLSLRPQQLSEVPKRLAAVRAFAALPEAAALAAANKRVGNILKKVEGDLPSAVSTDLLQEPAEQALYQALSQVAPQADAAFAAGDYTASLQTLATLRDPVDAFFNGVMVNAEDLALRANRLALLAKLHQAMNQVADLAKLAS
ncbi:MAG: glycine--tRNA ligase subunit beta [Gallionella sp.]|nr:glycine--tRNA ligase subunit beta [Gallionella sp.]MDD4959826.1 glycine--tRNA ligase subunit beta [Gallionella sp.]